MISRSQLRQLVREVVEEMTAKEFAIQHHEGQTRKFSGEPYVNHPLAVGDSAKKLGLPEYMLQAAYLHDTLEDTEATYDDIKESFGKDVADIVQELTSDKERIDQIGKTPYLTDKMINMSSDALTLKLLDRYDNVRNFANESEKFVKKYSKATREIIDGLVDERPLNSIQNKIVDDIYSAIEPFYEKFWGDMLVTEAIEYMTSFGF
jgi:(p)ppGpp synthase/HD superfamily hydrolase